MLRRIVYSLILAGLCLAVLATRVSPGFERIRIRVVTEPRGAVAPTLTVSLPDLSRLSHAPAAVILRARGAAEPVSVRITLDDLRVTRVLVPPGQEQRFDVSAALPPGPGHQLVLAGDRAGWQLTYLELANIYGHSSGLISFVIVPPERPVGEPPPAWLLLILAAAALAAAPRLNWLRRPAWRWLYRIGVALAMLVFAAVLVADRVSPYRILLSVETFLLLAAILYAEPLVRLGRFVRPGLAAMFPRVEPFVPHAAVVVLVLWSVGQFYRPDTGFTSLIVFGDQFEPTALTTLRTTPHAVDRGSGYDGQFYAQIALDPLLRNPEIVTAVDDAAYRGRRILLPWIAWLAGLGQPFYVLQAYALLNVVSWAVFGLLLLRWLPAGSVRTTLPWIAVMCGDGLLSSMRQAVPDGPSILLLALGVIAIERQRPWLAAGALGLAGLTRETNLLGGVVCVPDEVTPRAARTFIVQALLVAAPLLLWSLYLWQLGLQPAGAGHRNFALPFVSYAWKWQDTLRELRADGWDSFARFSLLALLSLTTQFVVLVWHRQWRSPWWRLGIAYAVLMLLLGQAVWEGHPGAVTRVTIPMTVAFNILLPRVPGPGYWFVLVLGNASVLHGLEVMRVPWLSG